MRGWVAWPILIGWWCLALGPPITFVRHFRLTSFIFFVSITHLIESTGSRRRLLNRPNVFKSRLPIAAKFYITDFNTYTVVKSNFPDENKKEEEMNQSTMVGLKYIMRERLMSFYRNQRPIFRGHQTYVWVGRFCAVCRV